MSSYNNGNDAVYHFSFTYPCPGGLDIGLFMFMTISRICNSIKMTFIFLLLLRVVLGEMLQIGLDYSWISSQTPKVNYYYVLI